MTESRAHRRYKSQDAGTRGSLEVPVNVRGEIGYLDVVTSTTAIEIERSGNPAKFRWSAEKLAASRKRRKILRVPSWDMEAAYEVAREISEDIQITNLSDTEYMSPDSDSDSGWLEGFVEGLFKVGVFLAGMVLLSGFLGWISQSQGVIVCPRCRASVNRSPNCSNCGGFL